MPAGADAAAGSVGRAEFAALMTALGPFEAHPHIAVACSGGADSMALALLLHDWTRSVAGRLTALTVDHRLRPESGAEARQVADWLGRRGITHETLARPDAPSSGNLQAAARRMRYALLSSWCRGRGVLHLALAHHREDQAETLLLRLARGSGVDGLAAMAAVSESADVRLLRPLLTVERSRLAATLEAAGQPHVEDPSNENAAFRRVRLRHSAAVLAREGLTAGRLAATAARLGRARAALDDAAARLLAEAAALYPEGYALLDTAALRTAPAEIALRALARVVTAVSGSSYPPRFERTQNLYRALCASADGLAGGRTLGGCRILSYRGRAMVCRESGAADMAAGAAGRFLWDGRFRVVVDGDSGFELRRLGRKGWLDAVADRPSLRQTPVPAPVRPSLPSFWHLDVLVAVPHLNYVRQWNGKELSRVREVTFAPSRPLTSAPFISGQSDSESLTLGDALCYVS
jgi:tRNA(Ile)-lysidine synthase